MQIESMGTRVYGEVLGDKGSAVVLLHGWGCSTELMMPVAQALSKCHRVLVLDFPGFGKSGRPPEAWGVPEYAACLAEVLQQLKWTPCAVVAHSFGCRVATWLAAEKPALFTRLIFTGAAGIRPQQSEAQKKRSEAYRKQKQLLSGLEKLPLLGKASAYLQQQLRQKYGSPDYNALDEEMRKTFVKVISLDLSDCYEHIAQPTLLLWGDKDTETPLWMGRRMEEAIPDAALILLEGGTHFAYLEQIQRFNAIVNQFLSEETP